MPTVPLQYKHLQCYIFLLTLSSTHGEGLADDISIHNRAHQSNRCDQSGSQVIVCVNGSRNDVQYLWMERKVGLCKFVMKW